MLMTFFRRLTSARTLLLITTVLVLLVQTYWFTQSARTRGFATGDAGVKLWQVQGILRTGDLHAPLAYPGAIYDPEHQYSPFVEPWSMWFEGQPYSEYTSPFIWISAPLYAAFGHGGLLLLPWVSGALIILMTAWLVWRVRPDRWACLAPLIVGLSSPLLLYSLEFWEHTPGTALAVFAMLGVIKAMDSRRHALWLMASGAAIGLSLTMRAELYVYPIAIVIGLVSIRSARSMPLIRSVVWLAVGGLIAAGPWWLYQFVTWGSPFGPRLQQNVPVLGGTEMLARLGDSTGRNWSMLWPAQGDNASVLIGLLMTLVLLALITWTLRRRMFWVADVGFWIGVAILISMAALIVWQLAQGQRPDDLLTTFPIVLLLLLPAPRVKNQQSTFNTQQSSVTRFLLVVPLAFVILVVLVSPFQGGIQWGPRFLLPIIPPLSVLVIDRAASLWGAINRSRRAGLAAVFLALFIAGSVVAWQGVQFMRKGQIASEFMSEMIRNLPERVVVADAWFLPQMAPYTVQDKIWFLAEGKAGLFNLLQRLRKETDEPGFIYTSALTWTHMDPLILMGPRLMPVEDFEKIHVDTGTQYVELSRYLLLK
jgi:4-amino-4-deoxy-L-arabinose transferase-like glycosyltransferase